MSRDWTPQEQYLADKQFNNKIRNSKFTFVYADGTEMTMESNTCRQIRKQYRELSFLYSNLPMIYRLMAEHPKYRKKILSDIENRLEIYVQTNSGNIDDPLWLWYTGRLDKNFYYSEWNDKYFSEYLMNEFQKLIKK